MKRNYWIIVVYIFLIVVGVPWYWPNNINYMVIGLPLWVIIAIITSICASFFTAFILLRYKWNIEKDIND